MRTPSFSFAPMLMIVASVASLTRFTATAAPTPTFAVPASVPQAFAVHSTRLAQLALPLGPVRELDAASVTARVDARTGATVLL